MSRYHTLLSAKKLVAIEKVKISALALGLSSSLQFVIYACAFWAGGFLQTRGVMTFGDVTAVFFAISMSGQGASQILQNLPDSLQVQRATNSVFAMMADQLNAELCDADAKRTTEAETEPGEIDSLAGSVKNDIYFDQIGLRYSAFSSVFHNLSLVLPCQKITAIVGSSGSGKSSIFALLLRLYEPYRGTIRIGSINILVRDIDA